MPYYPDLREYLNTLEAAGKLRRIQRRINRDTELHPLVRWQFRGLDEDQRAGWLFENLTNLHGTAYDAKVASSVIGASREVYALALQCSVAEVLDRWQFAHGNLVEPELVASGPAKEVVHVGDTLLEHGGLDEFPIPVATNGWEGLPRLTAVCWHSRDPEDGSLNVGTYNGLQLGPLLTNCRVAPKQGLMAHWQKAKRLGQPLQVAAVVGPPPAVTMASVAKVAAGLNELALAGGLAREPIPVVRCETSDLTVPAAAEVVIEGEIPTDFMAPDGASGEHTGFTQPGRDIFVFHVKCITHRKYPIWQDIICQMPPSESSMVRAISSEGTWLTMLQQHCGIPQVKDVAFHHCSGANRMCVIRMREIAGVRTPNETVWQALTACLSLQSDWPKFVIAVDEDIDPHDLESVFWAVSFRCQPQRDTRIVPNRSPWHDPSAVPWIRQDGAQPTAASSGAPSASAMLIDATRKWAYTPVSLPKRSYMEQALTIWNELELPKLKPREPWYGTNLGAWPEEYQRQAELAEKGEYGRVADELLQRGHPV